MCSTVMTIAAVTVPRRRCRRAMSSRPGNIARYEPVSTCRQTTVRTAVGTGAAALDMAILQILSDSHDWMIIMSQEQTAAQAEGHRCQFSAQHASSCGSTVALLKHASSASFAECNEMRICNLLCIEAQLCDRPALERRIILCHTVSCPTVVVVRRTVRCRLVEGVSRCKGGRRRPLVAGERMPCELQTGDSLRSANIYADPRLVARYSASTLDDIVRVLDKDKDDALSQRARGAERGGGLLRACACTHVAATWELEPSHAAKRGGGMMQADASRGPTCTMLTTTIKAIDIPSRAASASAGTPLKRAQGGEGVMGEPQQIQLDVRKEDLV